MAEQGVVYGTQGRDVRRIVALGAGAAGLAAYNWWLLVLFVPGMVHTTNGFFSDFASQGQPHASALQTLDLVGGSLLVLALLLSRRARPEWPWLLTWAAAAAIGGRYPYACAADVSAACSSLEVHLQLPVSHYVHMAAGIIEFGAATMAIWRARARRIGIDLTADAGAEGADGSRDATPDVADWSWRILLVGYPLLAIAYFSGRGGILLEPVFFASFSATAVAHLRASAAERAGQGVLGGFVGDSGATIAPR
ncbi:MAG: Uncharacterized protein JWN46_2626 [Acidimicrobiales bacterium]|nr:Uncharacterized protein [Acidimicrobiales bacterium]